MAGAAPCSEAAARARPVPWANSAGSGTTWPGTPFRRQIPALAAAFDSDRLPYGSDRCWTPAGAVLAQVASVGSAEQPSATDTWPGLTTRTAQRLLAG